jgi:Flp pilus assembly protein TadG
MAGAFHWREKMMRRRLRIRAGRARATGWNGAAKKAATALNARRLAARFGREEDGALVVFSMFLLLAILLVTGLGLDLMRTETMRTRLQATLDRAVLAAASATQPRDPEQVVRDYFAAAGLSDYLQDITVEERFGLRAVSATASADIPTSFIKLVGIDKFEAASAATAREYIAKLEISMVLDVSGSMGWRNKLDQLKEAGSEFIETVFNASDAGATSVSIVPFASQVNAGAELLSYLNVTDEHDYSNCIDFDAADFESTALDPDAELQRSGHFDPWSSYQHGTSARYFVCRTEPGTEITPFSGDAHELIDAIEALSADGNTSAEIGMKWGVALLDPSLQPVVQEMIADGRLDAAFMERPVPYDEGRTLKVVVLMTDGENTTEYVLKDEYREGPTDVWYDPDSGRFSIWAQQRKKKGNNGWGNGDQCAPGNSSDHNNAENRGGNDPCEDWAFFWPHNRKWKDRPYGGDDAYQLTYPELWARASVSGHAYMRYLVTGRSSDYYDWLDVYDSVRSSEKDDRLDAICSAAKEQGIVIYTIGFEVDNRTARILSDCATTPSHFFRVEGLDIAEAFRSIASSISVLRLTQ